MDRACPGIVQYCGVQDLDCHFAPGRRVVAEIDRAGRPLSKVPYYLVIANFGWLFHLCCRVELNCGLLIECKFSRENITLK